MTHEEFDRLVREIENGVGRDHDALRRRVMRLAMIGYAGLLLPLATVVLAGLALLIPGVLFMPDSLVVLILGALVLGVGGVSVGRVLWVRTAAPPGRPVTREETPGLFQLIDEVRGGANSARFHRVIITGVYNAAVAYAPRLGVLGWNRNHLVLGLPLMEGMTREEFAAVLAHECAHLSRRHHRTGNWIYRQRRSWQLAFERFLRPRAAGEISLAPFFKRFIDWFWPRFNAHAFVLSRAEEYEADAAAARFGGAEIFAGALIHLRWHSRALDAGFFEPLWRESNSLAEPPAGVYTRLAEWLQHPDESQAKWLREAFTEVTDNDDTHPCLKERLAGIGRPGEVNTPELAGLPWGPQASAAAVLLGRALPVIREDVEKAWRQDVREHWTQLHRKAQVLQDRVARIDPARDADVDALWDKAHALLSMNSPGPAAALLRQMLALDPAHIRANYTLGIILLREGDASGELLVERALAAEPELFGNAAEALRDYYQRTGQSDRIRELYVRQDKFEKSVEASRLERSSVSAVDVLIPHGLTPEETAALREIIQRDPNVVAVDLARKELQHFVEQRMFVMCVHAPRNWFFFTNPERESRSVQRLIKEARLPGRVFIFPATGAHRGIARKLARSPGSRVFSRA